MVHLQTNSTVTCAGTDTGSGNTQESSSVYLLLSRWTLMCCRQVETHSRVETHTHTCLPVTFVPSLIAPWMNITLKTLIIHGFPSMVTEQLCAQSTAFPSAHTPTLLLIFHTFWTFFFFFLNCPNFLKFSQRFSAPNCTFIHSDMYTRSTWRNISFSSTQFRSIFYFQTCELTRTQRSQNELRIEPESLGEFYNHDHTHLSFNIVIRDVFKLDSL